MVQQALELFASQFEGEQLVQEAEGGGDYPASGHTSHLQAQGETSHTVPQHTLHICCSITKPYK